MAIEAEEQCGWFTPEGDGISVRIPAGGDWTVRHSAMLDGQFARLRTLEARQVLFDLSAVTRLDSTGAMLLRQAGRLLEKRGARVRFEGLDERFHPMMALAERAGSPARHLDLHSRETRMADMLHNLGATTYSVVRESRNLLNFLGVVTVTFWRSVLQPRRFRPNALIVQMEQTGLNALLIVGLLQFLIGVVLAYLMADQFRRFGAEVFTVNLIGLTVLQEAGVLITAILLAGRSGSAFTAQIGTMRVNEEIDAMQAVGLDPIEVLVLPRVLAMMITLPLLTFFADLCGLVGGAVAVTTALDISFPQFFRQLQDAVGVRDFMIGMVKAPVHAVIIALVGCYEGLRVERSAESVGRMTTRSVVEAIVLVILATAVFAIMFSVLGIR